MMKRDPSIHIRRSSLIEILAELVQGNPGEIADEIFYMSDKHAIRNRVILQPTAKQKKAMARTLSVDKTTAEKFHATYQQVNMANNIRTSTIKATDSKYATMKEVAMQAKEFCEMFKLDEHRGFQVYVEIGIQQCGNNYSIYRLKGAADKIIKYYEDMTKIDGDKDKDGTRDFYTAWKNVSIQYLGKSTPIVEPHLFVHFIHGREAADKVKAKYEDWISAQFERWAALGSTPELSQFYGDNAALAYTKYIGLKNKEYDTTEEKTYFEEAKVKTKTIKRRKSQSKKGV